MKLFPDFLSSPECLLFFKNSFRNTLRVSNSLNPDQARQLFAKGYQHTTKVAASKEEYIHILSYDVSSRSEITPCIKIWFIDFRETL